MQQTLLFATLSVFSICVIGCKGAETVGRFLADAPVHIAQRMEHKAELLEQRRLDGEAVHLAKLAELEAERDYLEKTRHALIAEQIMQKKLQNREQAARLQLQEAQGQMEIDARTPQYKSKLNSQVCLQLGQSLDIGQLQVNIDKLKGLIAKRDQQHKAALKDWEDENKRSKLTEKPPAVPPVCPQCDVCYERGCCPSCAAPAPMPFAGGRSWQNRQNLTDEAARQNLTDADCARPLRDKLMDEQPTPKPILPTEIPLMLPVNLVMDIGPAQISGAEVRRIPLKKTEKQRSQLRECKPDPRQNLTDSPPVARPCPTCAVPYNSAGECPRCRHGDYLETPPAPAFDQAGERNEEEAEYAKQPSPVVSRENALRDNSGSEEAIPAGFTRPVISNVRE